MDLLFGAPRFATTGIEQIVERHTPKGVGLVVERLDQSEQMSALLPEVIEQGVECYLAGHRFILHIPVHTPGSGVLAYGLLEEGARCGAKERRSVSDR